ncbi:OTU-like cysteine protease domain-containing protein [Ditylenchus destructor]|uniref:OTU-like cysteine protease domain-containing protein n=1 Tax=Ditylenchus destructor TaxID=166010 RepID=A0AAD4N0D9_9BILA|nr:OTU-like cysteine protease domain-containing protein [Ditylenchus destructor]
MSENEDLSPLAKLKSTQSKEKKELQAKIVHLKHSVTKEDKKRKKEVAAQIENFEKELRTRHETQLKELEHQLATLTTDNTTQKTDDTIETITTGKKPSKAQIRREKKNEAERRRAAAAEMDERNAEFSQRKIEFDEIKGVLLKKHLCIVDIAPDGDCLFNALAHQATTSGIGNLSGASLRHMAAEYLRANRDDFLPFLIGEEDNDEIDFDEYCSKVDQCCSQGGSWGGEPELRAISCALKRCIEVIQPNGQVTVIGGEFGAKPPLVITYHRFAYALGEHYNSTAILENKSE